MPSFGLYFRTNLHANRCCTGEIDWGLFENAQELLQVPDRFLQVLEAAILARRRESVSARVREFLF